MPKRARRIQPVVPDPLTRYLDDIGRYRLLNRAEEAALGRRIRAGDGDAVNELACANLRFVVTIAKQYRRRDISLLDLIDEGNVGLLRAARKFDETRGIKFISYAVWWIRQAIRQAVIEQSRIIRIPAGRAGDLASTISLARAPLSLDAPITGDDNTLLDYIADGDTSSPDEEAFQSSRNAALSEALSTLRPREASILRAYFGLDGGEPLTLEQIGAQLGITRERVRQIRDRALGVLRRSLPYLALAG